MATIKITMTEDENSVRVSYGDKAWEVPVAGDQPATGDLGLVLLGILGYEDCQKFVAEYQK